LYAVGGAKVISTANVKTVFRGVASPFTTRNTTVEIVVDVFKLDTANMAHTNTLLYFLLSTPL
jgi:hypothetical protein